MRFLGMKRFQAEYTHTPGSEGVSSAPIERFRFMALCNCSHTVPSASKALDFATLHHRLDEELFVIVKLRNGFPASNT